MSNITVATGTSAPSFDTDTWRLTGYDVTSTIDGTVYLTNNYALNTAMWNTTLNTAQLTQTFRQANSTWRQVETQMTGFRNQMNEWNVQLQTTANLAASWGSWMELTTRDNRTPEQVAKEKRHRARAEGRARRLLKTHLTDLENDQLLELGYFEVESLTSGRRYRIYRGISRNIVELDAAGSPVARLCAHGVSSAKMPTEDHMLAQKLYLEAAEDQFRKIANISGIGKVEARDLLILSGSPLAA